VTEGIIDGLSAASAGYRAVAVLSATLGDEMVAAHLAHLRWPLVLAFDPDEAGVAGAQRLAAYLEARGRPAASLDLPAGRDVNDALRASSNWSVELTDHVRAARRAVGIDIPAR
jgi:DNA primase